MEDHMKTLGIWAGLGAALGAGVALGLGLKGLATGAAVGVGAGVALLALPKHRRITGLALAAFFVAIFPGNIAQYMEGTEAFGLDTDGKRLARLFGQPVLVALALWAAGLPERGGDARR